MSPRMTRKEKQAHTRECLLHSAARVFAKRGMYGASVDDVAEDAGFSKGAVYANFKNKEDLFLAMVEERFAERGAEMNRRIREEGEVVEQAQEASVEFVEDLRRDPEWQRLFFEMCAYAGRNEEFRKQLVVRWQGLGKVIAGALQQRMEKMEGEHIVPYDHIAMMLFAMANGFALEKLLSPEDVDDEVYGTMLTIFFLGLKALSEQHEEAAAAA
jgi:AcrR family transcriptional regulator